MQNVTREYLSQQGAVIIHQDKWFESGRGPEAEEIRKRKARRGVGGVNQ